MSYYNFTFYLFYTIDDFIFSFICLNLMYVYVRNLDANALLIDERKFKIIYEWIVFDAQTEN